LTEVLATNPSWAQLSLPRANEVKGQIISIMVANRDAAMCWVLFFLWNVWPY